MHILDTMKDILGDALVVAPLLQMADIYVRAMAQKPEVTGPEVATRRHAYFFVFMQHMEGSHRFFAQRTDDLPFVFGAPLLSSTPLGHFSTNYNHQEATLAQVVINYWVNFIRFG